jgi:hypothetical protein
MRRFVSALLVCDLAAASPRGVAQGGVSQGAAGELSATQRDLLDRGAQVFVTTPVDGSRWPRASVYQYVDATPEEAAAVFADFDRHATYMPGLERSRIARVIDPRTVEVDYVLAVPIMSDERYTVRDRLSRDLKAGSYKVEWTLVKASSTKAAEGSVRFEPYRNRQLSRDGTLVAYVNLVSPGSRLAGIGFVRNKGLARVRETVRALVQRVEAERQGEPAVLAHQVAALRVALGS